MKTVFASLFSFALILFVLLALPTAGEEAVYNDVLRLHVLANSDTAEDQEAKILVRDAILALTEVEMQNFSSLSEARAWVEENASRIEKEAERVLREAGLSYEAAVTLEKKHFDTRAYDGFTWPAGEYASLTVTLGQGKGQNFWCMLYPSLCTANALGEREDETEALSAPYTLILTESDYALRFRTLEILAAVFGQK